MAKKPDLSKLAKSVSKDEATRLRQQRGAKRAQVITENKELKASDTKFDARYKAKEQGYNELRDSLPDYPNAASHDTAFHDKLRSHIHELKARANFIAKHDVGADSEEDKKLGITQAVQTRVQRALPGLNIHLDNALDQITRSLAAHAHGANGGAAAYHTAHAALVAAHKHVADANRHLSITNAIGDVGNPAVGSSGRLMSTGELQDNLAGYEHHLRSSAINKQVDLPSGVLKPANPDLSFTPEFSDVGQAVLRRANQPVTAEERAEKEATSKEIATKLAKDSFREAAMRGKYTPTLEEVESGTRKATLRSRSSSYSGIGGTGLSDIKTAVMNHYRRNNPGKSYWESGLNDVDFKSVAKKHWAANNGAASGPNFDEPSQAVASRYVKKHLPDVHAEMLKVENHPAVKYAMKHNLGVMETPETVIGKRMRLMGETQLAPSVEKIIKNRIATPSADPTNEEAKQKRAKKIENPDADLSEPGTPPVSADSAIKEASAGIAAAKASRNAIFSDAATGGKA
jgi:hypothetical protein